MSPPRPATLLILAACLATTTALVLRERGAGITPAIPTEVREGRTRYAVLDGTGRPVGDLTINRNRTSREGLEGFATAVEATVRLDLLGATRDLDIDGNFWVATDGTSAHLEASATSDGRGVTFKGTVTGGRLVGTLGSGGEAIPIALALPADALVAGAFATPLSLPQLAPGQSLVVPSFDPTTLSTGRAELVVLRDEVLEIEGASVNTRVVEVRQGALRALLHVDAAGEVVRASTPFGLVLERRNPDSPAAVLADVGAPVVSMSMVVPTGATPHRGARRLRLRFADPAPDLPLDRRQRRLDDGSIEIVASGPATAEGLQLGRPADLAAEPLVQSDHPAIRAASSDIVAGLDDPWARARAIADWVFENIEKSPTATVPSALEVLATRAGDCNEHTVLYAALARAAGIPTRVAVGLVWSETHGAFAYHAWPEVQIGEHFVAIDPTLGEEVADATHITLLSGGVERWLALGTMIGTLEIDVLEVE